MNRIVRIASLAAAVIGLASPAIAHAQGMPTVAIMSFDNGSFGKDARDYDGLSKGVPAMLITDMSGNSSIRVIERDQVIKLLDEQKLTTSGAVDRETAVRVGKLLGAQHMIFGTFMADNKGNFRIDAKAVNVQTGAIEHVERVDGKADDIMNSVGTLASKLNSGMHLPAMQRNTGDASAAPSSSVGAQQAGAPAAAAATTEKMPMRYAVMYGKALDLKDKGQKDRAVELFNAVLKEFPRYEPAQKEVANLKKG